MFVFRCSPDNEGCSVAYIQQKVNIQGDMKILNEIVRRLLSIHVDTNVVEHFAYLIGSDAGPSGRAV